MSVPLPESRPEVVFLDLGDTLVRAHPSWGAVYRRVLAAHGVEVGAEELRDALERTFADNGDFAEGPFEASAEASYQRLKHFDTQVLAALHAVIPPDAFFRDLEAAFAQRAAWLVFPDVPEALTALRTSGIRLGVISNWGWSAPDLLVTLGLAHRFETLTISDRVGYLKPSTGIFRHALDAMGVPADVAMHVGDSVSADILGANAVGIRPVLIDREERGHGTAARPVTLPPGMDVPRITDLFDLLDLLGVDRPAPRADH